jgi:hypothetical protein
MSAAETYTLVQLQIIYSSDAFSFLERQNLKVAISLFVMFHEVFMDKLEFCAVDL